MFHYLDKFAKNDDATKAIFEHFRNVLTAGAVGAAGAWLAHRGNFRNVTGVVDHIEGGLLVFVSLGLIWIAITNAQVRLGKAGYGGLPIRLVGVVYTAFAIGGLFSYAITR